MNKSTRIYRKRGQGMTEFIILIAIIAIGAIMIIGLFGKQISNMSYSLKSKDKQNEEATNTDPGEIEIEGEEIKSEDGVPQTVDAPDAGSDTGYKSENEQQ